MVRRELAAQPLPTDNESALLAELSGMLRAGGFLHRSGDGPVDLGLTTSDPAVARRAFRIAKQLTGRTPDVATRVGGLSGQLFRILVVDADDLVGDDPWGTPRWVTAGRPHLGRFLRGAVLARGSVSHPRAAIHAELNFWQGSLAEHVGRALERAWSVNVHVDGSRDRVVLKSAASVGALLVEIGATQAFLVFDAERMSRELRRQAARLANADGANLARATTAARRHVDAIRNLVGTESWERLDEAHRETALTRLTNPDLSLADVGRLLDPPVSKATVHRRLALLQELAASADD